jgi:hypothetical protein
VSNSGGDARPARRALTGFTAISLSVSLSKV